jgi:hypothetical protein
MGIRRTIMVSLRALPVIRLLPPGADTRPATELIRWSPWRASSLPTRARLDRETTHRNHDGGNAEPALQISDLRTQEISTSGWVFSKAALYGASCSFGVNGDGFLAGLGNRKRDSYCHHNLGERTE